MSEVPATKENPPQPVENPAPQAECKGTHHKSETAFNVMTYGGIAGISTFVVGVLITYLFKHTEKGSELLTRWTKGLQKTGMSEKAAESALITTSLMMGGNAMVVPVKIAENHKEELIKKIAPYVGEKPETKTLEKEPKQSWGSLIKARLVAWGLVFASFHGTANAVGYDNFKRFEEKFSEHAVCKPLGRQIRDAAGHETKTFRVGKIVALDLFATAASSILLFVGSRFFAKADKKPKPEKYGLTELVPLREEEEIFQDNGKAVSASSAKPKANGGYTAAVKGPAASYADNMTHSAPALTPGL